MPPDSKVSQLQIRLSCLTMYIVQWLIKLLFWQWSDFMIPNAQKCRRFHVSFSYQCQNCDIGYFLGYSVPLFAVQFGFREDNESLIRSFLMNWLIKKYFVRAFKSTANLFFKNCMLLWSEKVSSINRYGFYRTARYRTTSKIWIQF